jgi:uncharacterized protein YfbU (UPF0304 family)
MATLTVRVDDDTRDALQEKAQNEGLTLSDLIRGLLLEAVVPVREEVGYVDGYSPDSLDPKDRQMFSLLHRILARVLPEDANDSDGDAAYQLERARVLEAGYTLEYNMEFYGIQNELSPRDCARVMDILDMFRTIDDSIARLAEDGTPIGAEIAEDLRYRGFDHNRPLEAQMAMYVRYMVENERWEERRDFVLGRESGNSHMPTLDLYLRMLSEYRRLMDSRPRFPGSAYLLSEDELQRIAAEMTHPANRVRN